jgi:tight adherence protein B
VTALVVALLFAVATWLLWHAAGSRPSALPGHPRPHADPGPVADWAAAARRWGRARGSPEGAEAEALDLVDALAPALRAGLPPVTALRLIASSTTPGGGPSGGRFGGPAGSRGARGGAADALDQAAARGEALAPVWFAYAEALRSDDLRLVAAAWTLCDSLGSPLAPTVATVSDVVRRRRSVRHRIAAALAGPRATMRVLTALPLSGPFVALAVGVSPGDLYREPAGAFSLGVGLAVLLLGRLWAGRMIRAVSVESRGPERREVRGLGRRAAAQRSESS